MKTKLFSFHIFVDYYEKLKAIADETRRSISSLINEAIREYLERRKK